MENGSLMARVGAWLQSWGAATVMSPGGGEGPVTFPDGRSPEVILVDDAAFDACSPKDFERLCSGGGSILVVAGGPAGDGLPRKVAACQMETLTAPIGPYRLHDWLVRLLEGGGPAAQIAEERGGQEEPAPRRVLVADDNPVNRKVAALMLRQMGCHVEEAADGSEALSKLEREPFDVVLMDVHMPKMDGLEACRRIRADRRYGDPRVLAMTALTLRQDLQRCQEVGMDGYISKPLERKDLEATLCQRRDGSFRQPGDEQESGKDQLIDEERLDVLRKVGGDGLVANMARLFVEHARKNREALERAVQEKDWNGIREAAHALKGSALNLGLARLGAVARRLEELAIRMEGDDSVESIEKGTALAGSVGRELDAAFTALRSLQAKE
ncbi:MAG TPA: response regulator [Acidobacteria bacterium]|nr:response regulator [Acidobacteriota bacterium]